jgi:hypothetical protein
MQESTKSTLPTNRDEVQGLLTSQNKVPTQNENKQEICTISQLPQNTSLIVKYLPCWYMLINLYKYNSVYNSKSGQELQKAREW